MLCVHPDREVERKFYVHAKEVDREGPIAEKLWVKYLSVESAEI